MYEGGKIYKYVSVWFLTTRRRWAPPRAAVTRWWPSTDPEFSPLTSLQDRQPEARVPAGRPRQSLQLKAGQVSGCLVGSFGLWRVCFPPCLVRPGRRLPVQGLKE